MDGDKRSLKIHAASANRFGFLSGERKPRLDRFEDRIVEARAAVFRERARCMVSGWHDDTSVAGRTDEGQEAGELVAEIRRAIWEYNNTRTHSALEMPSKAFAHRYVESRKLVESVSQEGGP